MPSNYEKIISEEYGDYILPLKNTPDEFLQLAAEYAPQVVNQRFGIVHIPLSYSLNNALKAFGYSGIPNLYTTLSTLSLDVSGITQLQNQEPWMLTGKGTLIGFIDTGINYEHPAFQNPAGKTRILEIWDQTIYDESRPNPYLDYGTIYTKADIDNALASPVPLNVVPSTDTNGHGTAVAGAACGTRDDRFSFVGAAPDAELLVVKLKEAKQPLKDFFYADGVGPIFQENDIMLSIKYLLSRAQSLGKPIIICLSVGSNMGGMLGESPLGQVISTFRAYKGIGIVAAGGNEGGLAHHYYGELSVLEDYQDVEILVPENTSGFTLELWGQPPEIYSIGLVSPTGEIVPRIPAKLNQSQDISFILERSRVTVNYELVQNISGDQVILLLFTAPSPGIWKIRVYGSNTLNGQFHMWLPMKNISATDVVFTRPDSFTTIVEPGNSPSVITVSAYQAVNNSLYINSSKGFTPILTIKPDFSAPGVDVTVPNLRDSYSQYTGTSIAAALTAGASAQIMEWSLQRYPVGFYTNEIKTYLIRGARRSASLTYPNREWGYGQLNVYGAFSVFLVS